MRLYLHFLSLHVRERMQYKKSFILSAFSQLLGTLSTFLSIYFVFSRFHSVEGFTFSQTLLSYSTVLAAFSISECFFRGFDAFSMMLGNGEFDRILVRPRGIVLQVICSKLQLNRIPRLIMAAAMLIYALPRCGVNWTPGKALALSLSIACGVIIFTCLFVIGASFSFFTTEGLEFMNIFTDGAREFGAYPFSVYGDEVLRLLTFVVPLALFQYWPMLWLLGRTENAAYALLPLASLWFVIPAALLWRFGVKRYRSTGS